MLLVQEYLMTKTLGQLAAEHGVYASFSKSGHKASFNYDQIEAKENDPLANQCRGLILATHDGRSLIKEAKINDNKLTYENVCPGKTNILGTPNGTFLQSWSGKLPK